MADTGGEVEVEAQDVIKLILQFCKENGLGSTFQALQNESQVSLNTVDNFDTFLHDIHHGHWDAVLAACAALRLPGRKLMLLYEQVVCELCELRENDAAKALLRQSPVLQLMKAEAPDRYIRLEHLCAKAYFDIHEAYVDGSNKEKRRALIAQELAEEVSVVPPSRLLVLVGQALKWQQHQGLLPAGTQFDVFRGKSTTRPDVEDLHPVGPAAATIKFGQTSHAESATFSPDGQFFVTGSVDGLIEVWDHETGKIRKDLSYQADEAFMMHEESILSLAFSRDSELLASADSVGKIKVWKIKTGTCVKRFEHAHAGGINVVTFNRDGSHVLSGGFDNLLRIHGMKSGKILKEFRGHTSYVNDAIFTHDFSRIISAAADGQIRVWDAKSTDCLIHFRPVTHAGGDVSISSVSFLPETEHIIAATRTANVYIMTIAGQVVRTLTVDGGEVVTAMPSRLGAWIYALSDSGKIFVFAGKNGKGDRCEVVLDAHGGKEGIAMVQHPHRNIIASVGADSKVQIWRP